MPLGNYTSQFFANVYLGMLDHFVKHCLKAKYYIRYVDDFIILYHSKKQLERWKEQIDDFLHKELQLVLHPQKSRIIPLSKGIDFVGFMHFSHCKLLRKRNIHAMQRKVDLYGKGEFSFSRIYNSYQGWQAYAQWGDTYKVREKMKEEIISTLMKKI